jgi:putative copper resistance protein D
LELSGWDVAAVSAKAVTYAATLGAAGAVFFLLYAGALLDDAQKRRVRRSIGILVIASAIGSGAKILILAGSMNGSFAGSVAGGFAGMVLRAGEGRALYVRLIGLALCALAMGGRSRLQAPALLGAIIASSSFALVGHIYGLHSAAAGLLLGLHLVCAAFWLGALAPLMMITQDGNPAQIAGAAARFGKLALWGVAVLLLAGAGQLWTLMREAPDLWNFWNSDYGRMMAAKLLVVAILLGIAAFNKFQLTPRLAAERQAAAGFQRSLRLEMLMGAIILLITAAFTTITGPPR